MTNSFSPVLVNETSSINCIEFNSNNTMFDSKSLQSRHVYMYNPSYHMNPLSD
uniref:Uncharacterized protein n=1 Tax=Arion vulgaris TaxID=1028688 RepID=A0A0B6ZYY0_9EUPU